MVFRMFFGIFNFWPKLPICKDYSLCMGCSLCKMADFQNCWVKKNVSNSKNIAELITPNYNLAPKKFRRLGWSFRPSFNSETRKSFQSSSFNQLSLWQQIVQVNDLTSGIETSSYLLWESLSYIESLIIPKIVWSKKHFFQVHKLKCHFKFSKKRRVKWLMIVFTSPHLCQKWAKSAVTLASKCLTDWCWKNQWICEWHTTRQKTCQEKETHVHRSSLTTEHHAIDPECVQATRMSGRIHWLHTFIYFVKYIWNSNWTAVVDESEEEVTGSNPVEALIFFRLLPSSCLNWKTYCDDHSSLSP